MEAVCILLGVKADWNTAKVLLADPTLIQKVITGCTECAWMTTQRHHIFQASLVVHGDDDKEL